jgi:hypothetical protein
MGRRKFSRKFKVEAVKAGRSVYFGSLTDIIVARKVV